MAEVYTNFDNLVQVLPLWHGLGEKVLTLSFRLIRPHMPSPIIEDIQVPAAQPRICDSDVVDRAPYDDSAASMLLMLLQWIHGRY